MSRFEYSAEVERRFATLQRAADPDEVAQALGEAGDPARGACVQIMAWETPPGGPGARLERVRFRGYGCPGLLAAADLAAERLEGGPREALGSVDPRRLAELLALPPEKLGRVLLVEDAACNCLQALRGESND
jgi:NifU-like protein involved in Fe-S cluster formation